MKQAADRRRPRRTRRSGTIPALDGGSDAELDYQVILEQFVARDVRGWLLIGDGRRVLALNSAARELLSYSGVVPEPISEVVRDVGFGFAVGDTFHDRKAVWYESFAPDPDRLLRFHLIPIMAETSEPVFVAASIEDITRLRHLETVRRDFVANVSHELRTPLASINLLVETLQNGALSDPEAGLHFLHRIEVETQAMARLVEELLDLSRLESGSLSLTMDDVDVRELLEVAMNRLAPTAAEKGIQVRLDLQDSLPPVRADSSRLEQVVMNLMHNAIKFTPQGGQVTVRANRQGRGVQIEVADTGVGMEAVEAARVFERFYKVDKGRNRAAGSGLGLAIARHLLELHGSRLQVVSEVGRGSRFYFAIPVAD